MASGCKGCPLLGGAPCNANCAWYRLDDGRCAVWQIADKLTDVENIALGLNDVIDQLEHANEKLEELVGIDNLNDGLQTVCDRIQEADKTLYAIWRDNGK